MPAVALPANEINALQAFFREPNKHRVSVNLKAKQTLSGRDYTSVEFMLVVNVCLRYTPWS